MQLLFFAIGILQLNSQYSGKLDTSLETATGMQPVFVRMENQLFKKSGDFEIFCATNEATPRSEVRKVVLTKLHANSDNGWDKIKGFVSELEAKGNLKNARRFWILNGFACDASAEACKALASRSDVSFVYLQTGPTGLRQHISRRSLAEINETRKKAMETAISSIKDDSSQPLNLKGMEIPWNLKQVQADQVWEKENTFGEGTIVALNDGGIFDIPSLQNSLWQNKKEKLDGIDNDANGYVDDIFGWDASEQSGLVLGNGGASHGTMCAGIIAGRPTEEKKFVSGVAPRTKLMIINGMGCLSGFEYALSNGADVFSMSYMFVNMELGNYRGVFRLAAEGATAAGMLLCGGAGNFANNAPEGKQITLPKDIPCVLAAAGTDENGSRPAFSSKGPVTWSDVKFYSDYPDSKPLSKPDVSAPASGFPCWNLADEGRPQWKTIFEGSKKDVLVTGPQGNSFAGPHTAGVAALMFSANKEINPWQVKRIIEQTAKDIGEPGRDFLHGAGVIQALEAVRKAKSHK